MKSYYKDFPTIEYNTPMGKVRTIDIMTRFKIADVVQNDPLAVYSYTVRDGDRPDIIANRYYGSADYAWLVMLSNDFFSTKDSFPLSEDQLFKYATEKYGANINSVHHYEDPDGSIVDQTTYLATPGSTIVTNYQFEQKQNESKRFIKLLSKVYLNQVLQALEETLEKINEA